MLLFEFLTIPILFAFLHLSNGQALWQQRFRRPMVAGFFSYFVNALSVLALSPFFITSYDWVSGSLVHFLEKFFLPFGIAVAMFLLLFRKKSYQSIEDSKIAFRSFLLAYLLPFSVQIVIGQGSNPGIELLFVTPVLWSILYILLPVHLSRFEKTRVYLVRALLLTLLMGIMATLLTAIQLNSLIVTVTLGALTLLVSLLLLSQRPRAKSILV